MVCCLCVEYISKFSRIWEGGSYEVPFWLDSVCLLPLFGKSVTVIALPLSRDLQPCLSLLCLAVL